MSKYIKPELSFLIHLNKHWTFRSYIDVHIHGRQGVMNDFYETYWLIFKRLLLLWYLLQRWEQHMSLMGIYCPCSKNASSHIYRCFQKLWISQPELNRGENCLRAFFPSQALLPSAHYKRRAEEACRSHCGRSEPEAPSNKQESSIVGNTAPHFKPPKTQFSGPTAAPALQEHLAMSFYPLLWTGGHRRGFVCRRLWYDSRNGNEAMDLH